MYCVMMNGDIVDNEGNLSYSYGYNSPNVGNSSDAWYIRTGGDVYYISNVDYWSYGI